MSTVESQLAGTPPEALTVGRVLVLEWYDGPRDGFIDLSHPQSCWYFQLLGERVDNHDVDSRLYLLSAVPAGVIDEIAALTGGQPQAQQVWVVPSWDFPDPA